MTTQITCDRNRIDGVAIRDMIDLRCVTARELGMVSLHYRHTPEPYMYRGTDGIVYRTTAEGFAATDVDGSGIPTTQEVSEREAAEREARRAEEFERTMLVDIRSARVGFSLRATKTPVRLPRNVMQVVTDSRVYSGTRDEIAAKMRRGGFRVA